MVLKVGILSEKNIMITDTHFHVFKLTFRYTSQPQM